MPYLPALGSEESTSSIAIPISSFEGSGKCWILSECPVRILSIEVTIEADRLSQITVQACIEDWVKKGATHALTYPVIGDGLKLCGVE